MKTVLSSFVIDKQTSIYFVAVLSALLAVFGYITCIYLYSLDAPMFNDDYRILNFINEYIQTESLKQKILLLLSEHNEHRITVVRLFTLLVYAINGEINFVWLIWIGNLGLFLTIILVMLKARSSGINGIHLVPVIFFSLTLSTWWLITWAEGPLQQYYQLFFAFLCIHYLTENKLHWAYLFFVVATFTGGGGFFLSPVIALYQIYQKNFRQLVLTLLITLAIAIVYFILLDYHAPSKGNALHVLVAPWKLIGFSLAFLGAAGKSTFFSILFGIVLLVIFAKNFKKILTSNPFAFWCLIYLVVSAVLTGINRADAGIWIGRTSHYSHHSLFMFSMLYIGILSIPGELKRQVKLFKQVATFSLFLYVYWFFYGLDSVESRYIELRDGIFTARDCSQIPDAQSILLKAQTLGTYIPTHLCPRDKPEK